MNAPIRTDALTGFKIFNTRAAEATEKKITGKSYAVVSNQALKELPPPPGAHFNAEEQAKYR